ncbi:MAG: hypothetical protein K9W44_08480 [Candidatus Lokiarchaeota archaeon]|nr:hypothetical protein [Candidatus Harpocratesius repetitus]
MVISIKSPNSDDIWNRWKRQNVKSQNLEKHYKIKGSIFNLENITAAEYVKSVEKGAIIFYTKKETSKPEDVKPKIKYISPKKINKEKYYEFRQSPSKSDWKDDFAVPFYSSLKPVSCSKCKGKGTVTCNKCKGERFSVCPDCGGNEKKCKQCSGTGKLTESITIVNEKGEKIKKEISYQCNSCFGSGHIICSKCGGRGKVPCSYCNASGVYRCDECDGYGIIYQYEIRPVPFKRESRSEPILYSSMKLSGLESMIGKDIQQAIDEVEGILISKPDKQLDKKFIEPSLGFLSKDIQKIAKSAKKDWENAQKNSDLSISLPIYLFPVLVLKCETKKGRKFQVYAIGSEKKYRVYGEI